MYVTNSLLLCNLRWLWLVLLQHRMPVWLVFKMPTESYDQNIYACRRWGSKIASRSCAATMRVDRLLKCMVSTMNVCASMAMLTCGNTTQICLTTCHWRLSSKGRCDVSCLCSLFDLCKDNTCQPLSSRIAIDNVVHQMWTLVHWWWLVFVRNYNGLLATSNISTWISLLPCLSLLPLTSFDYLILICNIGNHRKHTLKKQKFCDRL